MTKRVSKEIRLGSVTVPYTIRRSDRARRMALRMLPTHGLEVVLPRGMTQRDAAAFIQKEQDWVLRALHRVHATQPTVLQSGMSLPYLDDRLRLLVGPGNRTTLHREGDVVTVSTTPSDSIPAVLEAWYREEARHILTDRARVHASALGVELRRIAIKDTRSRWGSCSGLGNLNFSWRLMLAPSAVMNYVVAHEVAHLRELNHSPRFWQHVEFLCPDYRSHRLWLRQHGSTLAAWPNTIADH